LNLKSFDCSLTWRNQEE